MATLLDAPKAPTAAKVEEFVNRQLAAARRRVRVLDFFAAGLVVAIASLAFLLVAQFIDRAYETPPKTGWLVWGTYGVLAVAYLYWSVFRPSRREINPYYAAHELEHNVASAKNSLVTWVDLEDDQKLPPSIRTAIGQKAAKDLKGLDLNRAIANKMLRWVGVAAGVLLVANAVVAFLPPTRTALTLEEPANGDMTVFNNQDVKFQVRVRGLIPAANSPDAVRLRLWYNPEDPDTFEERPLAVSETDKRQFSLTIPPRQVRMGFRYRILAGNAGTPEYTVTCKIIPEFTGFDVAYEYPAYLKRQAEQTNDQNLLAPFGSTATLTVHTNRDVKGGYVEIDGQAKTIDGQLIEGQSDSLKFVIPFEKESQYRVWFTTTEGDKNADPKRFRLAVIDPKPVFRTFDVSYEYPAYLRWKPARATDVREPEIEGIRGSVVTLTAKTNRGVKSAQLQIDGQPPITGTSVPDEPMWVRFKLPSIDKDGTAKVSFTPSTPENPTLPRAIPIRAIIDQAPTVQLDEPKAEETSIPANGTLELKGFATDDHGIDGMTLQMKLTGVQDLALTGKPYRNGKPFLREKDNSWPTRVDYKDFVKLADIRMPNNPNFRLASGSVVEFWVEAKDNCTVPPGPNVGRSLVKRFKVTAPVQPPAEKAKIDKRNDQLKQEQNNHEQKQDKQLQQEPRPADQPPVKGKENPPEQKNDGNPPQGNPDPKNPGNPPMPKDDDPANPMPMQGGNDTPMPMDGMAPDPTQDAKTKEIEQAADKARQDTQEGAPKPNQKTDPNAKVDPAENRPAPKAGPEAQPPAEQRPTPMNDPNKPMGENGPAGEKRDGKVDNTKDEKAESKPGGDKPMTPDSEPTGQDKQRQDFGGAGEKPSEPKPEPKQPAGQEPKPEKGAARPDQSPEQKGMNPTQKPQAGANKPEKDVTPGEQQPMPQDTGDGQGEKEQPGQTAGKDKPKERPEAGENRAPPKKSDMTDTAGEARQAPKMGDENPGAGRPESKKDNGDQTAKSEAKPQAGKGQPNDKTGEQGELDREMGELDREINSPNPKMSDKAKSDMDRLMRKQENREKVRDELDKIEKNAKDDLTRDKAKQAKRDAEKAAENYDKEKPSEEKVDELAKKLNSKDKQEREDAEQRIKDWQKDQQTKKDLENANDQLKKKDPKKAEKVEQAMNKPQQKKDGDGQTGDAPKPDEQKLNDIAKDMQSNDPMKQADAQKQLEKMMNDPKTRDAAKEKLKEMAKDAKPGEQKDNLEKAAQKADEMAKANGQKPNPKEGPKGAGQKPDPKDLKDMADKLAGKDEAAKKDAENKLKEMMNDPAKAEAAKEQMKEMAKDAKPGDDKKAIEEMLKQATEMAKNPPKPEPGDKEKLKDLVNELKNTDPKKRDEAKEKLKEAMKDPKVREQMDKLKEQLANGPQDPAQQKAFNDLMNEVAGRNTEDTGTPDPADPKNRLKAAELLLENFKKPEVKEKLNWTAAEQAEWLKKQEATIANLKKQVAQGDWNPNRNVRPKNDKGPAAVKLEPKDGADALRGSRYAPPAGYADPYKKFTEDVSRGGPKATAPGK